MRRIIILLWLTQTTLAADGKPNAGPCLVPLAGSAGEAEPTLADAAYRRLLDTADNKLTPKILKALLEKGDPFTVPELDGVDLVTLNKNLKLFRTMLGTKGWDNPDTTQRLLAHVAKRAGGLDTAERQQRQATGKVFDKREIPLLDLSAFSAFSPDGEWIVTAHAKRWPTVADKPWKLTLYNLYDGSAKTVDGPAGVYGDFVFSPDGKKILFSRPNGELQEVPFEGTHLAWGQAELVKSAGKGTKGLPFQIEQLRSGVNPRFVYGINPMNTLEFVRVDRESGHRHTVDIAEKLPAGVRVLDWGFLPGTDELTVVINRSDSRENFVVAFSFNEKGRGSALRVVGPPAPESTSVKHVTAGNGEGRLRYVQGGGLYQFNPAAGTAEKLFPFRDVKLPPRPPGSAPSFSGKFSPEVFLSVPGRDEVAVLYSDEADASDTDPVRTFVAFWDSATGVPRGFAEIPIPDVGTKVTVSPDGNYFLFRKPTTKSVVVVPVQRLVQLAAGTVTTR